MPPLGLSEILFQVVMLWGDASPIRSSLDPDRCLMKQSLMGASEAEAEAESKWLEPSVSLLFL